MIFAAGGTAGGRVWGEGMGKTQVDISSKSSSALHHYHRQEDYHQEHHYHYHYHQQHWIITTVRKIVTRNIIISSLVALQGRRGEGEGELFCWDTKHRLQMIKIVMI